MNVTRRAVLQGALCAVAAVSAGSGRVRAVPSDALLVYDSRVSPSQALARLHAGRAVDLAHEHANLWRTLRSLRPSGVIVGLTSWSDLVQVRGLLESRGCRLRAEARCGRLFYWEMA
jgi:hypothetical protein